MRKKHLWKAVASSLLAFSLVVGACPVTGSPFGETVAAAETTWETVKEWNFDDSSAGTDGWSAYQYEDNGSKTAADTILSIADNKLMVTSDYSAIQKESGTWNPGGVSGGLIPIGVNGEARLTFDLYCKQGDALPSHIQLNTAWSDWSNGNYPSKSLSEVATKSNETATIEEVTYDKYQVEFPLTDLTTSDCLTNLLFIREDQSFNGTVYLDNIVLQKKVTSESGQTTGTVYTDDGPVVVTTTEEKDYPFAQFNVSDASNIILPKDTVIEYEMEIAEGIQFDDLYWETKIGWEGPADYSWIKHLKSSDFAENKRTEQITLDEEYKLNDSEANKWGVQVQTQKRSSNDVGVITCSALKITLPAQSEDEPTTDDLKETVIFSGNEASNTQAWPYKTITLQDAKFDMNRVVENGYFRVEYTTEIDADMNLVLSYYHGADVTNAWVGVAPTSKGAINATENKYYAEYSYDECKAAWENDKNNEGYKNLTAVQYLNPQLQSDSATASYTLTSVKWYGPALPGDDAEVLFTGEKTAAGKQASLFYDYTEHVGGTFDTSKINYGSYFEAVYTGDKDKLILSLSSNSGGTNWIAVKPSGESTDNGDGTYTAKFTIEDCIQGNASWGGFGTNMKRLDQIAVWTYDEKEAATITLKSLKYYPGDGELVDQNGESKWTGKKTKGIGLIGDSIVHNPLVNTSDAMGEFKLGDWNKILGRSDCSNWGIGGQTTVHIKNRIADMLSAPFEYDTLVTLCGINDMGYRSAEEIVANYKEIYEQIHTLRPTAKVYTISVLPTAKGGIYAAFDENGVADTTGQAKICEINRLLQELITKGTMADGTSIADFVTFVDCHSDFLDKDASNEADRIYANPAYVFQAYDETTKATLDGLHPNEAGYRVIANKLKNVLPEEADPGQEPGDNPDTPVSPTEPLQPKTESFEITESSSWPTFEFEVPNGGDIQLGTTIEYDVVVANNDFTKLYLETDVNWTESDVRTLKGSDFSQNADGSYTKHVTMNYVGEAQDPFTGVQVKIGTGDDGTEGGRTNYRGTIAIKNLTYHRVPAPAPVDESAFVTNSLFSGDTDIAGWGYTKVTQSVPKMAENGYFRVQYTASKQTNVRLVLCQWNSDKNWVQVRPSKTGKVVDKDNTYFAEYSYDACKYAFGSTNFSAVNEICVTVYEGTGITLDSVIWKGPKVENSNPGGNYDSGSTNTPTDNKDTDKKPGEDKDKDNKGGNDKDTNGPSAPVIEKGQGQNQNHTVGGQDFVVTKGGKDGKAEVAFMEAPSNAKKVVIPETVEIGGVTCKVTSIAAEAFKGNTKITSVTIPSNVKTIGEEAFAGCTSLTKVVVPASVTEIGDKAFYGCKKVETVTIGKNVTTINESAFEKCTSLKKVVISGPVKKIEENAFSGCKKLKKITITSTKLKSVGKNALKGLDKNAVIDVPDKQLKAYKKLFTAKTGFKKTMKLV